MLHQLMCDMLVFPGKTYLVQVKLFNPIVCAIMVKEISFTADLKFIGPLFGET